VAKLSIADKKEILRLYCETDATTTQLAKQYEISSSTVLRLLQELIPAEEYKQIVGQKQTKTKKTAASLSETEPATPKASPKKVSQPEINQLNLIDTLIDRENSFHGAFNSVFDAPLTESDFVQSREKSELEVEISTPIASAAPIPKSLDRGKPITKQAQLKRQAELQEQIQQKDYASEPEAIAYSTQNFSDDIALDIALDRAIELEEDLVDPDVLLSEINLEIIVESSGDDEFDEDGDDSDLEDDLDEDFEEEDDDPNGNFQDISLLSGGVSSANANIAINILPLEDAELPSTCYMVVDKSAEIITRPLRDFKELGLIPPEENQARTVALFDNHRIARRFSNQNQRVIKFPGDLIYVTHEKLAQKGITRLLFGGHVYAL
jgi:transposase-like protein